MKTLAFLVGLIIGFLLLPTLFLPRLLPIGMNLEVALYTVMFLANATSLLYTNENLDEDAAVPGLLGFMLGSGLGIGTLQVFSENMIIMIAIAVVYLLAVIFLPIITKRFSFLGDDITP